MDTNNSNFNIFKYFHDSYNDDFLENSNHGSKENNLIGLSSANK